MKISELFDELTYRSYRHQREISPKTSPERWAKIFGPSVTAMEERYWKECPDARDKADLELEIRSW